MKEQYIQMRRTGQYSFEWFFKYYQEHSLKRIDINFQSFQQVFNMYFSFNSEAIFEHLDREYGLTVITFEGKIIEIY
jgi:hypothetical protein